MLINDVKGLHASTTPTNQSTTLRVSRHRIARMQHFVVCRSKNRGSTLIDSCLSCLCSRNRCDAPGSAITLRTAKAEPSGLMPLGSTSTCSKQAEPEPNSQRMKQKKVGLDKSETVALVYGAPSLSNSIPYTTINLTDPAVGMRPGKRRERTRRKPTKKPKPAYVRYPTMVSDIRVHTHNPSSPIKHLRTE
jgi:hypothetical protein